MLGSARVGESRLVATYPACAQRGVSSWSNLLPPFAHLNGREELLFVFLSQEPALAGQTGEAGGRVLDADADGLKSPLLAGPDR
jgi:hypothetical protein